MRLRQPRLVQRRGPEPRPESSPAWDNATAEVVHAPPPAAPRQLSLFVFEDVAETPPRPRLRRLKKLLSALDPDRAAPDPAAAAGAAPVAHAPAPLWPDSFFD